VKGPSLGGHVVHFFDTEAALADVVATFLADGLNAGQPGLVIATDAHASAFRSRLSSLGVDCQMATDQGLLRFIDADAMLDELLVDGAPDWTRFSAHVGAALEQAGAGDGLVRAYGEMVDILWSDGRESAALRLEEMWNELTTARRFSLLCAYRMGNFYRETSSDGLRAVCGLHHGGLHRMPESADHSGHNGSTRDPGMLALEAEIGERRRLEAALRDSLAEQRRVEAELRDRNEELNDFLENASDGLHRLDADGNILWANRAELELLGYSRDEYIGRHIGEFHVDADVIAEVLPRLARNEIQRAFEARLRSKDGSIKHVRINARALVHEGKLVHIACLTQDMTAEKRAREETSRLLEALVEAARAKDEFIAMLSHELRGPLAPIRSALHLMQQRGDSGVTREREIIDRQVGNVIRLVDDLLDASRIAGGKIDLQQQRLDVADVIEMAVEIAGPALDARGHTVRVRASQGVAFVDGDAVRLAQVISNLLFNAAKYTERNGRVSVDMAVADGQAVISVRDTGIGIEADLLPQVFGRGVQGRHGVAGLGLGLAIVRGLVDLHGGTVTAHSEGPGCGSEFRVMLPLAESQAPTEPPPGGPHRHPAAHDERSRSGPPPARGRNGCQAHRPERIRAA
jgi:PAS domain S-box-containing protein